MAHKNLAVSVVIINWNNIDFIHKAIASVRTQNHPCQLIVIDNGSTDGSTELLQQMADAGEFIFIRHTKNLGFTGGANAGMRAAIARGDDAVALLNSDAVAERDWVSRLAERLQSDAKIGIVTSKLLNADGTKIDSTGDWLSIWGLPYPRGRGQEVGDTYDTQNRVLGASGGASMYRCSMLQKVGLFDNDFFAYYEDIDLSLRTRLAGWEVYFEPRAVARHLISGSSSKVKGFTTYQTMKNLPLILIKDIPSSLLWRMTPRFWLAYVMFFGRAIVDGRGWWALKGWIMSIMLTPKKIAERWHVQRTRVLKPAELWELLLHDLPPNATRLRKLRAVWHKIRGKS